MLGSITPVILTYNEEANIGRTLMKLQWAPRVIVVDSGSGDGTIRIARAFPNVEIFSRPFDSHKAQWQYAVEETGIDTDWILRLDADYLLTDELVAELDGLDPADAYDAFSIAFDYAIHGRVLRSSLYPPNTILFRRGAATIVQDGHTERWWIDGKVRALNGRVIHDDRKPMTSWMASQIAYMRREHKRLADRSGGWKARLRRMPPLMPIAVFCYALFGKGLLLDGRAGMLYALQRAFAEMILSLFALDERMAGRTSSDRTDDRDQEDDIPQPQSHRST